MPLPIGFETTFKVARAEIKKTLSPKDGKGPATVIKLGLVAPNGEKGWAEFFCPDGTLPPGEDTSETLILENSDYGLKAKRPRKGGWGGNKKNDASIEAQVAFKGAIELAANGVIEITEIESYTKLFAEAIRGAAK